MTRPISSRIIDHFSQTPPILVFVWVGLVVLTIALVVLMRTRWGQARPMRKCAVLSLLVHLLLACFATTIKVISSRDVGPQNPAISVALIDMESTLYGDATARDESNTEKPWDPRASGPIVAPKTAALSPPDFTKLAASLDDVESAPPVPSEIVEEPIEESTSNKAIDQTLETTEASQDARVTESSLLLSDAPLKELDDGPEQDAAPNETLPLTTVADDVASSNDSLEPAAPDISPRFADVEPLNPASTSPTPSTRPSAPLQPVARHSLTTGGVYRLRDKQSRRQVAERSGGSGETEGAVDSALAWLARAQSVDGRWEAARHGAGKEDRVDGHDRRGAGLRADTGVTGLALLAFLGAGHTHDFGEYDETVNAALEFLLRTQRADGCLAGDATLFARTYCHSMATFALTEALAMTRDVRIETAARRAVQYTIRTQHVPSGGWRYVPGDTGDTSQLGWQVMALRSAERAGIHVPDGTWDGVERFLSSVSSGSHRGLAGYRPNGPPRRTMTAEAAYCRRLIAERLSDSGGLASASRISLFLRSDNEAARFLMAELPGDGKDNLYYWYYASLFLHGRANADANADTQSGEWLRWNDALKRTLTRQQQKHGALSGSWSPDTVWGGYGGRVYSTAMATLCLEVYYRYAEDVDRVAEIAGDKDLLGPQ